MLTGRSRQVGAVLVALLVPLALAYFGIFRLLGAHPWWDVQTALIGAPIGCLIGLGLARLGPVMGRGLGLALLTMAIASASYGKMQFAASYAEDALAGKLWYFGWIGIAAGLGASLVAILTARRRDNR